MVLVVRFLSAAAKRDLYFIMIGANYNPLLIIEPGVGIEPTTYGLRYHCSAFELPRQDSA